MQAQSLSQAASSAISNNSAQTTAAQIGQVPNSSQLPFIKGLGLLPRTSINSNNERDKSRSSSTSNTTNQLSPLSLTPITPTLSGAPYSCSRCGNTYARPHSLNRHIRFECGKDISF